MKLSLFQYISIIIFCGKISSKITNELEECQRFNKVLIFTGYNDDK